MTDLENENLSTLEPHDAKSELTLEYSLSQMGHLIQDIQQYGNSKSFKELIEFVAKFKHMAPFNGFLAHVQNPQATYLASPSQWLKKFGRTIKPTARPIILLRPFGPVSFAYDVLDTQGDRPLPKELFEPFTARGVLTSDQFESVLVQIRKSAISVRFEQMETKLSGFIRKEGQVMRNDQLINQYLIQLNKQQPQAVLFATLIHELAHLYLGHLCDDEHLKLKLRQVNKVTQEIEAESVAYIVCVRKGIYPNSGEYLHGYTQDADFSKVDVYAVMQAAQNIEKLIDKAYWN